MNVKWILTILCCLLCLGHQCIAHLRLVQAIFKHGNRAPSISTSFYPNDPYKRMLHPPNGVDGLTNKGKMLVYKLGQFFRVRYDSLLGTGYSKKIVKFRSDEEERLIMTGQLVAAGMFPPEIDQKWNHGINWQPIPVYAPPLKTDYLYNGMLCEKYQKARAQLDQNKEIQERLKKYTGIFNYMSKYTGTNMTSHKAFLLYQQFRALDDVYLTVPKWAESVYYPNGPLEEIATEDLKIQSYTPTMKQMLAGVWLRELLDNINNYLDGNAHTRLKAYMYAAHDVNMAPILLALNVKNLKIPSYASAIMLELHEVTPQEFAVKVVYKDNKDLRTIIIPGCNGAEMCPLPVFKKIVEGFIPKDPSILCGKTNLSTV